MNWYKIAQLEEQDSWFQGSKVVDENGEPLLVYHGTNAHFNQFDFRFKMVNYIGYSIYFTIKN